MHIVHYGLYQYFIDFSIISTVNAYFIARVRLLGRTWHSSHSMSSSNPPYLPNVSEYDMLVVQIHEANQLHLLLKLHPAQLRDSLQAHYILLNQFPFALHIQHYHLKYDKLLHSRYNTALFRYQLLLPIQLPIYVPEQLLLLFHLHVYRKLFREPSLSLPSLEN